MKRYDVGRNVGRLRLPASRQRQRRYEPCLRPYAARPHTNRMKKVVPGLRPHAAPPQTNRMKKVVPGRVAASQTLPPGERMGKPGFPIPLLEGCALPNPPAGRGLGARASGPHPQWDKRVLLGGQSPPKPSRGRGCGETRFPHTPAPAAYFHVRTSCGCAAH